MSEAYILTTDSKVEPTAKAGTVVYPCRKPDYGLASYDARMLGVPCRAMTLSPDGDYPFFVVPCHDMKPAAQEGEG